MCKWVERYYLLCILFLCSAQRWREAVDVEKREIGEAGGLPSRELLFCAQRNDFGWKEISPSQALQLQEGLWNELSEETPARLVKWYEQSQRKLLGRMLLFKTRQGKKGTALRFPDAFPWSFSAYSCVDLSPNSKPVSKCRRVSLSPPGERWLNIKLSKWQCLFHVACSLGQEPFPSYFGAQWEWRLEINRDEFRDPALYYSCHFPGWDVLLEHVTGGSDLLQLTFLGVWHCVRNTLETLI